MLLSGYARNGDIDRLLSQVGKVTDGGRHPFVLMADFNRSPGEIQATSWLPTLDAVLCGDPEVHTCHQGEGSTIDLAMVSSCLHGYVTRTAVNHDVPWGPHDAISLWLSLQPHTATNGSLTVFDSGCGSRRNNPAV